MLRIAILVMVSLLVSGPAAAQQDIPVDVELVLAVDVSRSMSPRELEIQRRGYAEALRNETVIQAIKRGIHGRIALTYIEWAESSAQRVVQPWTIIENQADAERVAALLTARFDSGFRRTSISGAISYSVAQFDGNGFSGLRQVVDISGDGPNNSGEPVVPARDRALEKGVVINGLPLMTREGFGLQFSINNLDDYYRNCVIGGPASFVIPVRKWDEFPEAVRRKLVLELSQVPEPPSLDNEPVQKASFHDKPNEPQSDYDCLIGEKIWEQIRRRWFDETLP